ncbi:MAG: ROK family protein [Flavitalea sp.]
MKNETILGIDLGGTNLRGGLVKENILTGIISQRIESSNTAEEMLHVLYKFTDGLINSSVKAIGIGVPGLTDNGIVYDVMNIPSWKEIALQSFMQERYNVPVFINNDANCFALGEFYFGKGQGNDSLVGLTIGTGLGSGIIINKKLHTGNHCGAGEFGMIPYLDQCYEYYASGQFFQNVYGENGEDIFKRATQSDTTALNMYEDMGSHLGNAIKTILFALDINLIVLGGSVRKAFPYFSKPMWQSIQSFPFKRTVEGLRIEVSELENSGILGAAALYFDREAK